MGMPQIPDGKHRPNFDETIIDLLESIALEEMAMAHIMNAEGEKMQEIIKKFACREICFSQIQESFDEVRSMMNTIIMKEWMLANKMDSVIKLNNSRKDFKIDAKIEKCR